MAHIADVIKYEGDNATFIWKHPCEDFNSLTQLIVHENQEAIFFMNGQALDLFGPGRHTLETQNIPKIGKAFNRLSGGETPFHCEVYFINKSVHMGMKWGTDSRVHFVDPLTGLPFDIGASGEMNLRVEDSRKLLVSLVGTEAGLAVTDNSVRRALSNAHTSSADLQKSIQTYFRAPLMTQIKSYLSAVIRDEKINILEADAKLDVISRALQKRIDPIFAEYGLSVPQFYVTTLSLPEDDRNFKDMKALISQAYLGVRAEEVRADIAAAEQRRKLLEAQTEAQLRILRAQSEAEVAKVQGFAEAEVMRAKGYTQKDVMETDIQKTYAESLGKFGSNVGGGGNGGGVATDMVGMMAGMKVAETMLSKMDSAMLGGQPAAQPAAAPAANAAWTCSCGETGNTKNFCANCGQPRPGARTCPNCGSKIESNGPFCPECGTKL